jgi:hypothetical protein
VLYGGTVKLIVKKLVVNFFGLFLITPAFAQNETSTQSPFFQFIPLLLIIGIIVIPLLIIHLKYKNKPPEISNTLERNLNLDLNLEPRPWIRYLARVFDLISFSMFGGTIVVIIFPELLNLSEAGLTILMILLYHLFESLMLFKWSTTPGKALLNISITKLANAKLTYFECLKRSLRVWCFGLAMGIPGILLIPQIIAYKKLMRNKITSWDEEGEFLISHGDIGYLRAFVYLLIMTFYIYLTTRLAI